MVKNTAKCSLCGMCKSNCPVYKVTLSENQSPRGKAMLEKEELIDKAFFNCSVCGACKQECPADVSLEIPRVRKELVESGVETKANRKMIENIRKYGNPFGEKKDDDSDELYCC